jgi:diguanylate cyclase (GGDEF)-like protein
VLVAAKQTPVRSIHERSNGVRAWPIWKLPDWPIWKLPHWLLAFVLAVVLADAVVFGLAANWVTVHARDLELFAALLACSAATVEVTRRAGENIGVVKDVYATWELPAALLLPLAYVPVLPIVRMALTQWRIRRAPAYRRVFSAAVVGLSYVSAALAFHALIRLAPGAANHPTSHALAWMLVAAACAVVQWTVNQVLIWTAIKGANPRVRVRDEQFAREPMYNDVTELCVAVIVAFCVASSLIALVFAFPFITLLQRSLRHAQLVSESRTDSKTGLLNAVTWERQAMTELARAVRTRTALAIALLDIDRFKVINDTYGHLVGDQVLKEISRTLTSQLRDYDLAGRFGGEEFSLLLPQTRSVDAIRIAERIRSSIAALSIIAPGTAGGERVQVTVSIGVAALDSGTDRKFPQLMAAADAALYRAKGCGRDQVQMISTTRGLSAVSGTSRGINGAAHAGPARDAQARDAQARDAQARDAQARDGQATEAQAAAEPDAFRRALTS